MTLRLEPDDTDRLRDLAENEGRSMQEIALTAVREYVATHSLDALVDRALDEVIPRYAGALQRLGEL